MNAGRAPAQSTRERFGTRPVLRWPTRRIRKTATHRTKCYKQRSHVLLRTQAVLYSTARESRRKRRKERVYGMRPRGIPGVSRAQQADVLNDRTYRRSCRRFCAAECLIMKAVRNECKMDEVQPRRHAQWHQTREKTKMKFKKMCQQMARDAVRKTSEECQPPAMK